MFTRCLMGLVVLSTGCLSDGGMSGETGAGCLVDMSACGPEQACQQTADGEFRCDDGHQGTDGPTVEVDAGPFMEDDARGEGDSVDGGTTDGADGMNVDCPIPRVAVESIDVQPLNVVTLDGAPSVADDDIVSYQWTVLDRPRGSVSMLLESFNAQRSPGQGGRADDLATPNASFFVDLAGDYIFGLRVITAGGTIAPSEQCPEPVATVVVTARDDKDIAIEMVWDTPADADQTDFEGSDVDLHFRHPQSQDWFGDAGPFDCHFANPAPDWGAIGRFDDNPSLDIDDTNGAGPERITLNNPQLTAQFGRGYRVAVHYYRSEARLGAAPYGASTATVRVYFSGVLASETRRELDDTNAFWETVDIMWRGNEAESVDVNGLSRREP